MIKHHVLTENDKQKILGIMKAGEHQRNTNKKQIGVYRENVFQAFLYYCNSKNIMHKTFCLKNFTEYHDSKYDKFIHPFSDIPMGRGHVLQAMHYGHKNKYILDVSSRIRRFNLNKLVCDKIWYMDYMVFNHGLDSWFTRIFDEGSGVHNG